MNKFEGKLELADVVQSWLGELVVLTLWRKLHEHDSFLESQFAAVELLEKVGQILLPGDHQGGAKSSEVGAGGQSGAAAKKRAAGGQEGAVPKAKRSKVGAGAAATGAAMSSGPGESPPEDLCFEGAAGEQSGGAGAAPGTTPRRPSNLTRDYVERHSQLSAGLASIIEEEFLVYILQIFETVLTSPSAATYDKFLMLFRADSRTVYCGGDEDDKGLLGAAASEDLNNAAAAIDKDAVSSAAKRQKSSSVEGGGRAARGAKPPPRLASVAEDVPMLDQSEDNMVQGIEESVSKSSSVGVVQKNAGATSTTTSPPTTDKKVFGENKSRTGGGGSWAGSGRYRKDL